MLLLQDAAQVRGERERERERERDILKTVTQENRQEELVGGLRGGRGDDGVALGAGGAWEGRLPPGHIALGLGGVWERELSVQQGRGEALGGHDHGLEGTWGGHVQGHDEALGDPCQTPVGQGCDQLRPDTVPAKVVCMSV